MGGHGGAPTFHLRDNWWAKHVLSRLPVGARGHPTAARWVSLFIGAIGMATAATSGTFSVWQSSLRAILNQTETESNVMAQLGNVGGMIAFPAGMVYERYGPQANAAIGGVFSSLTFVLLWLATSAWKQFFASNMWLIYVVWFVNGFASVHTYMGSLMPNLHNWPFLHRGKVMGVLDATLSLGPTLLSVLYNTLFTNGHNQAGEEGLQDLAGFFAFLAILYGSLSTALFFFSGRIPQDEETFAEEVAAIVEDDQLDAEHVEEAVNYQARVHEEKPPNEFSQYPFAEQSFLQSLRHWNYYFFMMQFVFASVAQTTFQSNISTYLRSFNLLQYNLLFTVMNTTLQAVSKFSAGFISDWVAHSGKAPRAVVYLLPYAIQTLGFTVSIFYGDNFYVLLMTCVASGIGYGATWCQSPTLLGELFGGKHLASNWGWTMLFTGVMGFPYAFGFSAIYEAPIANPGIDTNCDGLKCFTWSFALFAGTSLCAVISALGLSQNMFANRSDRRAALAKIAGQQQQEQQPTSSSSSSKWPNDRASILAEADLLVNESIQGVIEEAKRN